MINNDPVTRDECFILWLIMIDPTTCDDKGAAIYRVERYFNNGKSRKSVEWLVDDLEDKGCLIYWEPGYTGALTALGRRYAILWSCFRDANRRFGKTYVEDNDD